MLSANLALMQVTRLTDDVSRYEGVSQLYVGKQGCESLSESPFPRVPQGGEGMIPTQRRVRSGSSIPWSRFVLLKTDTFGLACMFSGHGLFLSENCAGCSNSPIGLIIIQQTALKVFDRICLNIIFYDAYTGKCITGS